MDHHAFVQCIADDTIRAAVRAAIDRTLLPAAAERVYPGHFTVVADGSHFGTDVTWPGLDSWELAGAYLLLGRKRLVLDYFDFVRASQRADGNIPFAIFPGDHAPRGLNTHLQGMRYPDDVYSYRPVPREGQPAWSDMGERQWIGLFDHWQPKANPLSVLAPISYILTAGEIIEMDGDPVWLGERYASLDATGAYLLSRRSDNGLMSGAGFYLESPPRNQWDGVTQCYAVRAFSLLAEMAQRLGQDERQRYWQGQADELAEAFRRVYWRGDHFCEYVHPEHGVVDLHGLSDVNWAAIGLGLATAAQAEAVWPLLTGERALWHGDMPTQVVAKPYAYRDWELREPLSFESAAGELYDVAAMGRVWYLEALACARMGATERLVESVAKVCRMGLRHGGFWYERYHPLQVWGVYAAGPRGYCEYAAILVRVVSSHAELFTRP